MVVLALTWIFAHGDDLRELNLWMNGPRNHWGRGLFLSMDLVALFNLDPDLTAFFLLSIFFYTRSAWMEAEQVYFQSKFCQPQGV